MGVESSAPGWNAEEEEAEQWQAVTDVVDLTEETPAAPGPARGSLAAQLEESRQRQKTNSLIKTGASAKPRSRSQHIAELARRGNSAGKLIHQRDQIREVVSEELRSFDFVQRILKLKLEDEPALALAQTESRISSARSPTPAR
mgnify:CR=1 FL=1